MEDEICCREGGGEEEEGRQKGSGQIGESLSWSQKQSHPVELRKKVQCRAVQHGMAVVGTPPPTMFWV